MDLFIEESIKNKIKLINKIPGVVVYPNTGSTVKKSGCDSYVPELADALMLAFDIDKGTITKRMDDYTIKEKYQVPEFPVGWYMSEKFDGQRALWDGEKFVSRGSKGSLPRVYPYVPLWFQALMPPGIALDGEFFTKRDSFQDLGFLRSKIKKASDVMDLDKKWVNIKYQVFDTPTNEPFEKRLVELNKIINERCTVWTGIPLPPYINKYPCPMVYTTQLKVTNQDQVDEFYSELISLGAEGVMLRAPKIPYLPYRTRFILKIKPSHDAECKIIGYKPGTGKYLGMLGAFECEMILNGKPESGPGNLPGPVKTFFVSGMTDVIRSNYSNKKSEWYHPKGTIITYLYTFLTKDGLPRHPRYLRITMNI